MESIKELREKLQGDKVHPDGWKRPFGYKLLQRGPSIYITRFLLPFNIKPNYITIASIACGVVGAFLLLHFNIYVKLLGLFLLYLNIVLDKVDGEVARYKNTFSLKGIYLDEINHIIVPPLFWLCLGIGLSNLTIFFSTRRAIIIFAALNALLMIGLRITNNLAPQIYAKKYIKYRENFNLPPGPNEPEKTGKITEILKPFKFINQLQDFLIIILLTALLLIIEIAALKDVIFHPLLHYFVVGMTFILSLILIETIIKGFGSVESKISELEKQNAKP